VWYEPTLLNGTAATSAVERCRKSGNIVYINGGVKMPATVNSFIIVVNLPAGFRPSNPVTFLVPIASNFTDRTEDRLAEVQPNGNIVIYSPVADKSYYTNFSFIADQ
jgi:hypothetical protein